MRLLNILIFVLINIISLQAQDEDPEQQYYWGFVVESQPYNGSDVETILRNVETYEYHTFDIANDSFIDPRPDIIVFPEKGLTGVGKLAPEAYSLVPSPDDRIVPCGNETHNEIIQRLSCAARDNQVYVVVNVPEREECKSSDDQCPERGWYQYNTNVVFDRNGTAIARYRKYNLIETIDEDTDRPPKQEISTFVTDFGVKFLVLTGQDLLYGNVVSEILKNEDVTDIVYPNAWRWTLPFLTELQYLKGLTEIRPVSLLAAGLTNLGLGCTGEAIYDADGSSLQGYTEYSSGPYSSRSGMTVFKQNSTSPNSKANNDHKHFYHSKNVANYVYRNVNTKEEVRHHSTSTSQKDDEEVQLVLGRDNLEDYKTFPIEISDDTGILEGSVSGCSVNATYVKPNDNQTYYYRLVAKVEDDEDLIACALLPCVGPELKDCGVRPEWGEQSVNMTDLSLKGTFALDDTYDLILPSSLEDDFGLFPLFGETVFEKEKVGQDIVATISYEYLTVRLLSFGIYGERFPRKHLVEL